MKSKKTIKILAALALCSVLMFNFTIFPNILASIPEKSEMKTVSAESVQTDSEQYSKQSAESTTQSDINAVSEEQAIEKAINKLLEAQYTDDVREWPVVAKYITGTAPANDPIWVVVFKSDHEYKCMISPEDFEIGMSYDKFKGLTIETEENGNKYFISKSIHLHVVEVNALNGEAVNATETDYLNDNGNDPMKKLVINLFHEKYGEGIEKIFNE